MNARNITNQLLALEQQIQTVFARTRTDYRGRVIDLNHVLHYFYHDLYRMTELIDIVLRHTDTSACILDVGLAYGFLDVVLKVQIDCDIIGIELPENISVYCDIPKSVGIPLLAGGLGMDSWPVEAENYDLAILGEVLEHLRISPLRALKQLRTVLRPDGYLLLTTPNIAHLSNIAKLTLGRNILQEFPDDDAGLEHITDNVEHIREYTMPEVKALLERAGFVVEIAHHSWSWDRYNHYLLNFSQANMASRLWARLRASLLWLMPCYRREMIFLARKA